MTTFTQSSPNEQNGLSFASPDSSIYLPSSFTVAIPTFNGATRLPLVLEKLRSQVTPVDLLWDIIVIDNNSNDQTDEVVKAIAANFPVPLRSCLELRQGAGYARKRAIQVAQSDLIGFLDDDNIPDANWVAAAYQFAQAHPQAGAWASRICADLEVEPPPNVKRLLPFLAITERGRNPSLYVSTKALLPPSAGLVVRRPAWIDTVPEVTILGGRVEGNMLTGEDLEVLSYIQRSRWEIWYNPEMQISHKIPATRLTREYLIPFFRGIGLSRFVTRMLRVKPAMRSLFFLLYLINDLKDIIQHWLKYRTELSTDLALTCELELMKSSLISPFYLWRKGYLKEGIH